ncbi:uncharacterized protein LOC127131544 [Lathyrus oleraceus]|uniref:uncharacterized protein LOC127131544 n=1 Tax=Pisum sativum TaxID=3888 RepID=UPI0021D1D8DD|nr:uncharacterized protein LOC127131544 [Pisum sativum]
MNDPDPPARVNKPMSMTSFNKPRSVTALSKSSVIVADRDSVVKNICVLISNVLGIDPKTNVVPIVSISLAQPDNNTDNPINDPDVHASTLSPEKSQDRSDDIMNEMGNKDKNHVGQPTDIVNIEDLDSDDVHIGKILAPSISKMFKNRKGQVVGSSNTPSKSVRKKAIVGPTKRWSKDIISISKKQASGKKIPANILEVPLDNISFHSIENVEKWKYVYQRRLALERELGKDVFECKEVLSLIQEASLMKTVTGFGKCYEMLVKEFIVNISKECDNKMRKEFKKVYVRGRCVDFSPEIINRFLGRNEEEHAAIGVSDNVICKEITTKQALSKEECDEKADGIDEEEDNEDKIVTSDEEETSSDEN